MNEIPRSPQAPRRADAEPRPEDAPRPGHEHLDLDPPRRPPEVAADVPPRPPRAEDAEPVRPARPDRPARTDPAPAHRTSLPAGIEFGSRRMLIWGGVAILAVVILIAAFA